MFFTGLPCLPTRIIINGLHYRDCYFFQSETHVVEVHHEEAPPPPVLSAASASAGEELRRRAELMDEEDEESCATG